MSGPLIMLLICGLGFIGIVWAMSAQGDVLTNGPETPENLARDRALQERYGLLLGEASDARWNVIVLEMEQKVNYLRSRAEELKSEKQRVRSLHAEIDRMNGRWL